MNIRKQTLTLLAVALLLSAPARMNAQVSIGADVDPQDFSLLEVTGNNSNGLRLPQMTDTQIAALKTTISGLNAAGKNNARGLTVMNTTTNCMEIYDGSDWRKLCEPLKLDASKTTAILYGYNAADPYNRGYGIDVEIQNGASRANLNEMKIAYTNGLGKSISAYTSATVHGLTISYPAATLQASGDLPLTLTGIPTKRGAFDIPVVIDGQTVQVRIHVGCGMYIGDYSRPDNYLLMMCINWGTSAYMDWSTDPFNPTKGSNGDYFQWGRTAAVADANTAVTHPNWPASIPNFTADIPAFYNKGFEASPVKDPTNDPCPAGWRLPTKAEWTAAFNTIDNYVSRSGTWQDNPDVYSTVLKLSPKGLNQSMSTLGLPVAGLRSSINGRLSGRSHNAGYWSSAQGGPSIASSLLFAETTVTAPGNSVKGFAITIRCATE